MCQIRYVELSYILCPGGNPEYDPQNIILLNLSNSYFYSSVFDIFCKIQLPSPDHLLICFHYFYIWFMTETWSKYFQIDLDLQFTLKYTICNFWKVLPREYFFGDVWVWLQGNVLGKSPISSYFEKTEHLNFSKLKCWIFSHRK